MRQGFLRNPAPESTGGSRFQEGNIQVLESVYKVHHPDVPAGQTDAGAKTALAWLIQRLDENLEIMKNEDDEPITEAIFFPVGGSSLAHVHPGKAERVEEVLPEADGSGIEDLGDADNTEGNTLYFVNPDYQIHPKASLRVLVASMDAGLKSADGKKTYFTGAGVKPEFLERIWAPDWVNCIFHMTTFLHPEVMMPGKDKKEYPTAYKIITKVHRGPGEKAAGSGKTAKGGAAKAKTPAAPAGGAPAAGGGAKAATNGAGNEVQMAVLAPILDKLSEDNDGQTITVKAFNRSVLDQLTPLKLDAQFQMNLQSGTYKDEKWLAENGPKYDITFDAAERTITFGAKAA